MGRLEPVTCTPGVKTEDTKQRKENLKDEDGKPECELIFALYLFWAGAESQSQTLSVPTKLCQHTVVFLAT